MDTQIKFTAGKFERYTAARTFGAGGKQIQEGDEILFDGTFAAYDGSPPEKMQQLRGAVKTGWLVPTALYNPNDRSAHIPRSANVQVRSANGGNPMDVATRGMVTTVAAEEREVGNVQSHAQRTRDLNNRPRPGQRVASNLVVDPRDQEGIPVRTLQTPAKQSTNFEHVSPGEALRQAKLSGVIQAGEGRTREDMMAEMDDVERMEYQAALDAKRGSYVEGEDPEAAHERALNTQRLQQRQVVGRVASVQDQQKEGFQIHNSVGGGIEIADASGMGGENVESVTEMEGLTFRNTNVGKPKPAPSKTPTTDVRRKIARSICPDFPDNYVFDDPIRKKIARLQADYDDRPDVIRAVAAAETDPEMKERLVEDFPSAFA